jgi:hypothetical protein
MSDQPTTCPKCGARTDMLSNMLHTTARLTVEECLNPRCRYIFFMEDDPEFENELRDEKGYDDEEE